MEKPEYLGDNLPPPAPRVALPLSHPKYQGIAEERGYSQESGRLKRIHYTHDALIDLIIAEPTLKQGDLALKFGYSEVWISRIMGSDAFQARLAQRRDEIIDPFLIASTEERLKGLVHQSLDVLADKLQATKNPDLALKSLDIGVKALGFGARDRGAAVQNNFVVQLPGKARSAEEWAEAYSPAVSPAKIVESRPVSSTISGIDPLTQPEPMKFAEDPE